MKIKCNSLLSVAVSLIVAGGLAAPLSVLAADAPLSHTASPDTYKLLFENDQFRVILQTSKPGARDALHSHFVAKLAAAGMLIGTASPGLPASTGTTQGGAPPVVTIAEAPPGAETFAVRWVKVAAPGLGDMVAAVARPRGAGPFPTVVLLHGSHGFAHEYVRLAQDLAEGGVQALAACWFRGSAGSGSRFVTPIGCSEAPAIPGGHTAESKQIVDALVQAARTLPGARPDRIGLFGHSRGGAAALNYSLGAETVHAAVLNSAVYPKTLSTDIKVPILILHGTADSPADGGIALTNIQMARDYEEKLRVAGKLVEAVYYEGGRHNDIFASPMQYKDALQHMLTFLLRHLHD